MSAIGLRDKSRTEIQKTIDDEVNALLDADADHDTMLRSIGLVRGLRVAIKILDSNVQDLHAR